MIILINTDDLKKEFQRYLREVYGVPNATLEHVHWDIFWKNLKPTVQVVSK